MKFIISILLVTSFYTLVIADRGYAQSFTHPGLLQGAEDLERIRTDISKHSEPVYSGFLVFKASPQSQSTYRMQGPLNMVSRNPTVGQGIYDTDAAAAYQNALMWTFTGKKEYAEKAIEIIDAWSSTLKVITGRDAVLMAGLGPFKMINAAEILRYTHSGWTQQGIKQAETHFKNVIYPVICSYALFANGNWDTAAMKTAMAIGVFCNDRPVFEDALRYYTSGAGNGSLTNYIINETGQCQESGRDQAHTQLGIAHLADCSEIAWQQGLDLYAYAGNRLLSGFEYTAKYNLGFDVNYSPYLDRTGKYFNKQISTEQRGKFRTIYEQVYNHYMHRVGLSAPYTQMVAEKIRPESEGNGGDNVGFGTLLYSRTAAESLKYNPHSIPAPVAGLTGVTGLQGNRIYWVESANADSYIIKRSGKETGPYQSIATGVRKNSFIDQNVKKGHTYYYTVIAQNKNGHSDRAYPVGITAGLPPGWTADAVKAGSGYTAFDGNAFKLECSGAGIDSTFDSGQYIRRHIGKKGIIIARYVPQLSSQLSGFGLVVSEKSSISGGKKIILLVSPRSTGQLEAPKWEIKMLCRGKAGIKTTATQPIEDIRIVSNARLTGYLWLKIEFADQLFRGYYSADGIRWADAGEAVLAGFQQGEGGLFISSGIENLSTAINYDHVLVK